MKKVIVLAILINCLFLNGCENNDNQHANDQINNMIQYFNDVNASVYRDGNYFNSYNNLHNGGIFTAISNININNNPTFILINLKNNPDVPKSEINQVEYLYEHNSNVFSCFIGGNNYDFIPGYINQHKTPISVCLNYKLGTLNLFVSIPNMSNILFEEYISQGLEGYLQNYEQDSD